MHVAPNTGDTLIFDPNQRTNGTPSVQGTDTNSNDDMGNVNGFSIATLTLNNGYDKKITLDLVNLTVTGNVNLYNGTIAGPGGEYVEVPNATSIFTWGGGTLSVNVTLGSSGVNPTLTINGNKKYFPSGVFLSYANATWTGTGDIDMTGGSTFDNATGGMFQIQSDVGIDVTRGSATFDNEGTFKKSLGTMASGIAADFNNNGGTASFESGTVVFSGAVQQNSGKMTLNGGNIWNSSAIDLEGGTLEGINTITGDVRNVAATVHPGLDSNPGIMNIVGDYTQSSGGTLVIDFNQNGSSWGKLNVQKNAISGLGGTATLDGALTVRRNGYQSANVGSTFTFMTWVSVSGDFATADLNNFWTINNITYGFSKHKTSTTYYLDIGIFV